MITKYENYGVKTKHYDIVGLSTDAKPTNVSNASTFYEMDTTKLFMFDEENHRWLEQ